jgi:hypothetical protein
MFKKIISVLLIGILVFSFAACGKKGEKKEKFSEELTVPEKKTAILVAPEAQYPEYYNAAKSIAEAYPDNIVVREYPDTRGVVTGTGIIDISAEIAADPEFGAIIYAGATLYTTEAIKKAKSVNDSIITLAIEPEQSMGTVAENSDLVFCADWEKYAKEIIDTAKKMGAEYFVLYSYDRHVANNPLYAQVKRYISVGCEENDIKYIFQTVKDPVSVGVNAAQYDLKSSLVALFDNRKLESNNAVLFSTDPAVQPTLVELAEKYGMMYISPSFPTAYNGLCEYFDAKKPESMLDTEAYKNALTEAIFKDSETKATYALYTYTMESTLVRGAVYTVFDMLSDPELVLPGLIDRATLRLKDTANVKKFTAEKYIGADNVIECYAPGFEILEYEDKK